MVKVFNLDATSRFKKSMKRIKKRKQDWRKIRTIIEYIQNDGLQPQHKDHALKGKWRGHRECHIEADWLLVYRFEGNKLILADTGSHADIFDM